MKQKPTAQVIVARLNHLWGCRLELLYLEEEPYKHYRDNSGDEVPYSAIENWQEVTI